MEDGVRVLGPPIKETTLGISYDFAPEKLDARRISVSFNVSTAFVELIDLYFLKPMGKHEVIRYFDLKEPVLSHTTDWGTLIEFYTPANVALHYDGPDDSAPVVFFSHFDPAILKKKPQAPGVGVEGGAVDAEEAADRYFEMGLDASDQEDYPSAIGYVQKAIELNPRPPYYHVQLGIVLLESGRPEPAIRAFEKAISIEPGYDPYYGLGMCYFEKQEFSRASAALAKARHYWEADKDDYSLLELLGLCYLQQRQYERALDEFRYLHKKVYDKTKTSIDSGIQLAKILELPIRETLSRLKTTPVEEFDKVYLDVNKKMDEQFETLKIEEKEEEQI